jgi:RHS repeat-associated protein
LYDAAGTKLRKTVRTNGTVTYVQDYLSGGIEYRQNGAGVKRVESVFHVEGRYFNTNVDASNTLAWRREYNIKDLLGNTRVVISDRNANGVLDITSTASTSDVLQENHYYAFGLGFEGPWLQNDAASRDNQHQYNGKELHNDFGFGIYSYGFRFFDPVICRFISVDPLAVKCQYMTTYQYASNLPTTGIDMDGLEWYDARTGEAKGPASAREAAKRGYLPDPKYVKYDSKLFLKMLKELIMEHKKLMSENSAAKLVNSDRIEFGDKHPSPLAGYSKDDDANAADNIKDAADGKKSKTSPYSHVGEKEVALAEDMLAGMLKLSEKFEFTISEITGGGHSNKDSRHYAGLAFDVNSINGKPVNVNNPDYVEFMKMARKLGATEVLGPGSPGHSGHIHVAWPRSAAKKE